MAVYCTIVDVRRRLGEAGTDARVDDDPDFSDDILDEASSLLDEYLLRGHDMTNAASNRWTKNACANVAALLYCERRGNPPPASVQAAYDRTMASLEAALSGTLAVPGLARKRVAAPCLSNVRVKLGPEPHTVVERMRGPKNRNPQDYGQRIDYTELPTDYT